MYKITRKKNWASLINEFNINHCDDPVYDYYYCGDWLENLAPLALGWETDVLFLTSTVGRVETVLGFSQISICRTNNLVKNIAVCMYDSHREHGHGTIFLNMLLTYLFQTRKFRKGYISVLAENAHMKHLIEKTRRCKLIGTRTKHTLRRTGEYSDSLLYEIFADCS